ncbi:ribosome small subunit-dependent GTPase A [Dyella tabacisoli]|uniref:Small ribosomal subunit biogenesis GTPase RsgA n=1 Tax=Dyella tabacisoli TaxID=2282381 RepID=A0A369UY08_9GAMM|nr:ribosome small subunit-dependent GTPase A [Dyella tabacisoli]RDD83229.1 ribosome small subunit-dependent GTPase A [Dyella tabacisoli]
MSTQIFSLHQLGWRPAYAQHLTIDDFEAGYPARVVGVHRNGLAVLSSQGAALVALPPQRAAMAETAITVGDWVMVEQDASRMLRLIERQSLIARVAAGSDHRLQSIAANLDTLFIVTSCNDDFNPSRLERYLALAFEAAVTPVVILTKPDMCADANHYADAARQVAPSVTLLMVNATDATSIAQLRPWLQSGQTVAFIGSSGVGKSTLTNMLVGDTTRLTAAIREDDAKGRHTTTSREMYALASGAWVIDTPGMRELRIGAASTGMSAVFDDIETLAAQCRFRDCRHESDEGCAIVSAMADGELDGRRFANYFKLQREAVNATLSTKERHERDRQFGTMSRTAMRAKRDRQGR